MSDSIYILTNECMPGLVKIGRTTTSVEQRMRELYTTSVPYPFQCFYAASVEDGEWVEKKLHFAFGEQRVPTDREFFRVDPNRVKAALELAAREEVTPHSEPDVTDEMRGYVERKSPFRFSLAKVPFGAELQFVRDEAVTCKVLDDRSVEFRGKKTSLSAAASDLLREGGRKSTQVQGPLYWLYEGETLVERRLRLELES